MRVLNKFKIGDIGVEVVFPVAPAKEVEKLLRSLEPLTKEQLELLCRDDERSES